jgi:2-(1,2-epoxy-1,2-dihydrophenyl)acetyl-CoA isomerase
VGQPILVERAGQATRIIINRPEVRNALNLAALEGLVVALEDCARDDGRVVIIEGAGGSLSSGGDIEDMLARRGKAIATVERLKAGLGKIVMLVTGHPKPVIAKVDGDAVGAGCAIALACDFLLASEKSRFGFPFVKVGLVPDTGSSWILPHIVGIQQARRLLLTGELISSAEADDMGLVTQRVHDGPLLQHAVEEWVERMAKLPAGAVSDAKRLLWHSLHVPLSQAVANESILQGIRFTTEEHAKAVDAFLAKRKG